MQSLKVFHKAVPPQTRYEVLKVRYAEQLQRNYSVIIV